MLSITLDIHVPDTEIETYVEAHASGDVTLTKVFGPWGTITFRGPLGPLHRSTVKDDLLLTRESHDREDSDG